MKKTITLFKKAFLFFFFLFSFCDLTGQNLIQNGNFSTQNFAWSVNTNFFYGNAALTNCLSCPGYAYSALNFSGTSGNNLTGELTQIVSVPANTTSATFSFNHFIGTFESNSSGAVDVCFVQIWDVNTNSALVTLPTLSNLDNSSAYVLKQYSLPSIVYGKTIKIRFAIATNPTNITTFRLDDIGLVITTAPATCVSWENGVLPTNQITITAAEYLCQRNIISNFQSVQDLLGMSLGESALATISGIYNGNVPISLPSDNFPILVTDIQVLPFYEYQAVKALCYIEGSDGRPCINRDYYTIQPKATVSHGRALRMLLEGWNIAPDTTGFDIYSHASSNFLCNVLKDDPNYGYFKKAYQLGLINDFISGGCFNYSSSGEFLYVILYKLHSQNGSPAISAASYFSPNNFDPKNVGNESGIERAVFQTYEQNGFSIPGGGLSLDFDYSYHSSLLEYPTTAEDWQGRSNGNLENHKAILKNFPMGKGWTHSYNIFANILRSPNSSGVVTEAYILFHWGDGSIYVYNIATKLFETKGVYDDFVIDGYNGNGDIQQFHIVTKNKITYCFYRSNNQFYCTYIIDRNSNQLQLIYEVAECNSSPGSCVGTTTSRLLQVFDNVSNRKLSFLYQANTDLLAEVKDNSNRSIKFYANKFTYNLDSVSNARNFITKYKYCIGDTCSNMLVEIQRPKGNWIKNTYGKRKLLQTQTPNYTASVNFSTNYNLGSQSTGSTIVTTPTIGAQYSTIYQHNSLGLPTSILSTANAKTIQYNDSNNPTLPTYIADNLTGVIVSNTYDLKGNNTNSTTTGGSLSQTTKNVFNTNNDVTQTILPNGSVFNFSYDGNGNLINETGPLGFANSYTRNVTGTINTKTNAMSITSRFAYNSFGNLNKISVDGTNIQAEATYDNVSRVIQVKDANGVVSKYEYDNNDNVIQTITDTSVLKLTTKYRFDPNDNNDLIIAPQGDSTKLTYDGNDDLVREDYGSNFRSWVYHNDGSLNSYYNKNGHQFAQNYFTSGSGFEGLLQQKDGNALEYYPTSKLLKSTTRGNNKITIDYDALTRVNYARLEVPNSSFTSEINYEYDVSGFQTKISLPAINKFYKYVPDALNRVSDVLDWNNTLLVHYSYRADGNLQYEQLGNGVIISYHYDNAGRLDSMYAKNTGGTLLYAVGSQLDNNGNHIKESYYVNKGSLPIITAPIEGSSINYQYDNTNRLKSTNSSNATNDNAGNVLTNNYTGFINGTYDFWEHLTFGNIDGKNVSFGYDPNNNRFRTDTTLYIQDIVNNGNVLAERTTTSSAITKLFCHSPSGLVCSIDPATSQRRWFLYDFRGSTVAILDDNQTVVEYYKYEPFGTITESSHTPGKTTPFLYVGKYGVEYQSPHLYYMRARYYDPTNGRFYGEDPVWNTNLFVYADNNPLINIDPDGSISKSAKLWKQGWNQGLSKLNESLSDTKTYDIAFQISSIAATEGLRIPSGWKPGQPITNNTSYGMKPTWSTVRQRFWKNEALNNGENYIGNLSRLQKGLAPQRINPITGKIESMELHHILPQRKGGLFNIKKVWPDEHKLIDPFRK